MATEMTHFQINQINIQIERLSSSVDTICNRIIKLEDDLSERNMKKKLINFLFMLYPAIMGFLIFISSAQHQKVNDILSDTNSIMNAIIGITLK